MHLERFGSTDAIVTRQERAGGGAARRRPARRQRRQPGRAADRQGVPRARVSALRRDVDRGPGDAARGRAVLEAGDDRSSCGRRTARYACFTPLLGRPIILNLAGAFTLATARRRRSRGRRRRARARSSRCRTGSRSSRRRASPGFATPTTRISSASAPRSRWRRRCRSRAGFSRRQASSSLGAQQFDGEPGAVARGRGGLRLRRWSSRRPTARRSSPDIEDAGREDRLVPVAGPHGGLRVAQGARRWTATP